MDCILRIAVRVPDNGFPEGYFVGLVHWNWCILKIKTLSPGNGRSLPESDSGDPTEFG